jgi:ElaB/YqjD/DUF883 family membrane-anchored ribosome-binding protein
MKVDSWSPNNTAKTAPVEKRSSKPFGFESVKNIVADQLQTIAETIGNKATSPGAQPDVARYSKHASELLGQSADYVREFDYTEAKDRVQEYVKKSPERSLLIAGAAGLIIGALLRRR